MTDNTSTENQPKQCEACALSAATPAPIAPSHPASSNEIDRIILAPERRRLVPYSDMHIWRMERNGRFPKRIKLGPHRVGWSLSEVVEWIAARKAER